jgi:hypothetical protein
MEGSNIFMIYADSTGTNVTLSPRKGVGEVMPLEDMTAQVTLLGGSGISNGAMTANVKCKLTRSLDVIWLTIQVPIATLGTEARCLLRTRPRIGSGLSSKALQFRQTANPHR